VLGGAIFLGGACGILFGAADFDMYPVHGYTCKSEAALMDLFPGQRARVRSFFRKKRDYTADDGGKDPTPPSPVSD